MAARTIRRSRELTADRILLRDRRRLRRPHTRLEEVDVSRTRLAMPIDAIRRTAKDAIESTATAATPTRRLRRPRAEEEEEEEAMADISRTSRRRLLRTATTTADDRD